jgi:hypothetical protein
VGIVQRRDTGRPEYAYGRRCHRKEIEHELRVTDLALHFGAWPFVRGAKVGRTEADALMIRDENPWYIEIDNSRKMTVRKQMQKKWERYQGVDGYILVVATTDRRMWRLLLGAEAVKNVALFNTFERLAAGKPWVDWFGNSTDL